VVPVRSHAVMNLQPDGATTVHSVLDLRRCLRFERPKFEQRVSVARRRSEDSGTQANSAGSDQGDPEYAALKRRPILTVSENVTWASMDRILAVASLTE
jgi:hypothetical protein